MDACQRSRVYVASDAERRSERRFTRIGLEVGEWDPAAARRPLWRLRTPGCPIGWLFSIRAERAEAVGAERALMGSLHDRIDASLTRA